jgi:adenosylcobyric acid synthase
MVQGTMSSVGKSLLVAALCRIFKQDGWHVAPFKAQNMALNSFVTRDGRELGRAQAMQAEAAGVEVTAAMNPVLIKPEADSFAQVVVMGTPWARLAARDYYQQRGELWRVVTSALDSLRSHYDLVIIEGAGSPVELNLKQRDLVNMAVAHYADAPVLLVGDIDRGGIFAQLLGTLMLLDEEERSRVCGLIVNKFRGDMQLFQEGRALLEQRGGVPVLGVVPFLRDVGIADEDSVALDERPLLRPPEAPQRDHLDIVVVRLPHISNFDDFDPLRAEPGVVVRFVERADALAQPDLIILPGTKTTIADLTHLHACGMAAQIAALAQQGTAVLGICGGYQMLGSAIYDPHGSESNVAEATGLGLLPVVTHFNQQKQTVRAGGGVMPDAQRGLFAGAAHLAWRGYEIHMGQTVRAGGALPLLHVASRGEQTSDDTDGTIAANGWTAGTYIHGIFDNDDLRHTLLTNLATRKGIPRSHPATRFDRAATYERLAAAVRPHLDMAQITRIVGGLQV